MNSVFANNLRRLRQSKGYTQEQVADHLGVSPQSVSRWECGATFPDILLLPAIAEHYCVTVDDLFREGVDAYKHYADRLSSLYESTRDRDDFIRADNEYRRLIDSGKHTTEDLRSYGCMHMMAMWECADKAMMAFNEIIAKEYEETNPIKVFEQVYEVIQDRKVHPKEGSYTNYLFDKGLDNILKKLGEEATEIVIAAKNPNANEVKYEISDFLYHMMVLMAEKNITWEEITSELARR